MLESIFFNNIIFSVHLMALIPWMPLSAFLDCSVFLQFYSRVHLAGLNLLDTHDDATVSALQLGLTLGLIASALVQLISTD